MARNKKIIQETKKKKKTDFIYYLMIIILILVAGALYVYSKLDLINQRNWITQRLEKTKFPKKPRRHLRDIRPLHVLVWTIVSRVFTSPATVMLFC